MEQLSSDKRRIVIIALNALICILELAVLAWHIVEKNRTAILYYTNVSNLLSLITSAILVFSKGNVSDRLSIWRYRAVSMMTMTFLVVTLILSPMAGKGALQFFLFNGKYILSHLLCPVLSVAVWIAEPGYLGKKDIVRSIYPSLAYAAVLVPLNIARLFKGPYPFLQFWDIGPVMTVVWLIALTVMAILIGAGLWAMKFKVFRRPLSDEQ